MASTEFVDPYLDPETGILRNKVGARTKVALEDAEGDLSFARLMQRETGLSFGRWRQQLHLIIALRELASGVPVQNVAATLGYESVNAFITMFRKAMGSTPAHYFAERKNSGR